MFSRFEIDDQLELRGLLDRKIGRLGAFEDLVDIHRSATGGFENVRSIGEKAALSALASTLGGTITILDFGLPILDFRITG